MSAAEKIVELQPTTVSVRQPNEVALTEQGKKFLDVANGIQITDAVTLQGAADYLSENKAHQKKLDGERRELVDPLNEVVKRINAKFKPITDLLLSAESIIKNKIGKYQQDQLRIQREEQAKAEERARKERERLEARAEKAIEGGNVEKAAELQQRAATTVAVAPAVEAPKVAGASVRMAWAGEVTNMVELCKAIGNGELPPTLVEVKQSELNRVASTWQNNRTFPGLRITQKPVVASR